MKTVRYRVLAGAALLALASGSQALAAPLASPFLYAEQDLNQIVLAVDRNGDGDMNDENETSVFFDSGNASGLGQASGNVFALSQAGSKHVLIGDGDTDSVYRLFDSNGDGDANDADEARVWFSGAANSSGFKLNTPNGIAEGPDGAIYVVEADTNGSPTGDWVYRTIDLNGDGDANDEGEATRWLDLKGINAASSPFEIRFSGNNAFIMDTAGGTPDVIYRAHDADGDGVISGSEVTTFASEANSFGAKFDFAMDVYGDSLLTWQWLAEGGVSSVFSLTDLDSSGTIDQANEVVEAWSTSLLGAGYSVLAGFGLTVNQLTGEVLITSNGSTPGSDWIISLLDLDGDGTFFGEGEWRFVLDRLTNLTSPDRVRNVAFYEAPQVSAVPVPAALPLLAAALGMIGAAARFRRAR